MIGDGALEPGERLIHLRLQRRKQGIHIAAVRHGDEGHRDRSEEHTSELQSLMRISYAVFCLKQQNNTSVVTAKAQMLRSMVASYNDSTNASNSDHRHNEPLGPHC